MKKRSSMRQYNPFAIELYLELAQQLAQFAGYRVSILLASLLQMSFLQVSFLQMSTLR